MNKLTLGFAIALIAALGLGKLHSDNLKHALLQKDQALALSQLREQHLEQQKINADHLINTLHQQAQAREKSAQALQQKLTALEQQSNAQLIYLETLQDASAITRDWASEPLPAAIASLRQRPVITGARHYCQHLQHTRPLQSQPFNCDN